MAMAVKIRKAFPACIAFLQSSFIITKRSEYSRMVSCSAILSTELTKNFSTASIEEDRVKLPLILDGGTGNYASALFLAAKKNNVLGKVESELAAFVEASKKSLIISEFLKDLSVPVRKRIQIIHEISNEANFSDIMKRFLALVAEYGRLKYLEGIANKFAMLTMADRGIVEAVVTTVIPLPPQEEEDMKEALQDIIGEGKTVRLRQKIDPSILGGFIVEFEQKMFDMSVKTRAERMRKFLLEPIDVNGCVL